MTTQRDRLSAMLLEAMYATANDPVPDYGEPTQTLDGTWSAWTEVLADALLARGVRIVDAETTEGEFCQWSCPACGTDVTSIVRSRRVVDEGERVISAATAEALRDVVRAYLANDEKGLLGACADLSAGMEADR